MRLEVLNEIFERASVSGDPDIRTCASAILEYRLILDDVIETLEDVAKKLESGEPWQGTRCRALAERLKQYATPQP